MKKIVILIFIILIPTFIFSNEYPQVQYINYYGNELNYEEVIDLNNHSSVEFTILFSEEILIDKSVDIHNVFQVEANEGEIVSSIDTNESSSTTNSIKKVFISIPDLYETATIDLFISSEYIKDLDGNHLDGRFINRPSDYEFKFYTYLKKPIIKIIKPCNHYNTYKSEIYIEGKVYPETANFKINDNRLSLMSEGKFRHEVDLKLGENELLLSADIDGHISEKKLIIYREKKKSEQVIDIIAGRRNYLPVSLSEMNRPKLKIYNFKGNLICTIDLLKTNGEWYGECNNKYLDTGIYLYEIVDGDEVYKKGRLKYLDE